jgi:hypothetical protein
MYTKNKRTDVGQNDGNEIAMIGRHLGAIEIIVMIKLNILFIYIFGGSGWDAHSEERRNE